eukprot:3304916-Rhodomonas_salina.4
MSTYGSANPRSHPDLSSGRGWVVSASQLGQRRGEERRGEERRGAEEDWGEDGRKEGVEGG